VSEIPPNLPGSVLQSTQTQQLANDLQRAETDAKENAFRNQVRAIEQREGTVGAEDADLAVNADEGGGTGGQGRAFREHGEENPEAESERSEEPGISRDADGRIHIDLEA
jgi:hypothetical protein